ncbi:MAG: hypothetical protein JW812_02010 [Alphaproteobacteria bacterium]|nr:hypothetical protein [Alphaproteobacteria bacterium]MBN2779690.1 hypothetical protein [Alphaproteobacteria bacterium]
MSDENRAVYTPPTIGEKRDQDLNRTPRWRRVLLFIFVLFFISGGVAVFLTDPRILNGLSTPSIVASEVYVPVALLEDNAGNEVLSSLGCVVSDMQYGVAPLSYFERIKKEKIFHIDDPEALLEAFGCLMPTMLANGLQGIPVSATLGSEVYAEMPSVVHGVFSVGSYSISLGE